MKVDIHNYDKHLEHFLKKLDKLNSLNKDFILKFIDRLFLEVDHQTHAYIRAAVRLN